MSGAGLPSPKGSFGFAQAGPRLDRLGFAVAVALAVASLLYLALGMISSWSIEPPRLVNDGGKPVGRDFLAFWSASALALGGAPAAAYDLAALHGVQVASVGADIDPVPWHYPPTFLLLVLPLALLPYLAALVLWLAGPLALLGALAYRLLARRPAALLALLFPAVAQCLISGQNGIVSALLLGGGLVCLERRPALAGALFGLLTYKPQLAWLVPLALLFGRNWRALAALGLSAAVLAAASLLAFGVAPWAAFLGDLGFAAELLETGRKPWERVPTVFAAARLAGLGTAAAYAAQAASATAVIALLARLWRRPSPLPLRGAALAAAIPLATPFAFDYDLVLLLLPIAWLARAGVETGWRRGEAALLALLWAAPVGGWLIARLAGVQLTPLVLALLLAAIWRRARACAGPGKPIFSAPSGRSSVR